MILKTLSVITALVALVTVAQQWGKRKGFMGFHGPYKQDERIPEVAVSPHPYDEK